MCSKVSVSQANFKDNLSQNCKHSLLDTLAQLSTDLKDNKLQTSYSREKLQKRARSKAFTNSYLFDLIDLKSTLNKSYWQTFYCSKTILQESNTIKTSFCNQRWCLTCNRIRTANLINGYKKEIEQFNDPQFLTLTIPNVSGIELSYTINLMNKAIRNITKNALKTHKIRIKALKKYECTYNSNTIKFHPHFHFIINDLKTAQFVKKEWLKLFPDAKHYLQDIRQATNTSLIELCKYFTKVISKGQNYSPEALDIMFRAAKNKRTFQSIGIKKAEVSEDIEQIEKQIIDWKSPDNEIYDWDKQFNDWVSGSGEVLSEYVPTKQDLEIINKNYQKNEKKQTNNYPDR